MRRSRGFSIVELIAVMAIIAIVLELSLPAIHRCREDARKLTCRRNLSVIGLALHNYHDVYSCLPPGWILTDDAAIAGPGMSWMVPLLPYNVGEREVYNEIDFNKPAHLNAHPRYSQSIEVFRCPADESNQDDKQFGGYGKSSYAGVYGDGKLPDKMSPAESKPSGSFYRNSCLRFRENQSWGWFNDGLSFTLLVGERSNKTGSGIWPAARSNQQAVDVVGSCNHVNRINTSNGSFSSQHKGGAHFLYADGSVRFISEDIDSSEELEPPKGLYQKLANRRDGQKVDVDQSTSEFYYFGRDPGFRSPDQKPNNNK